jgi:hypothetical protein
MTFLERAGSWFLNSGIQEPSGGVARYYLSDTRRNAPVSTEITGYAVSTLVYLHSATNERAYLDAALRAARFLATKAWDERNEVFPYELPKNGDAAFAFFFDSGIVARGLFAAAKAARDSNLYRAARLGCLSMADAFALNNAPIPPVLALPSKEPLPFEPRWSRSPGCYQLKSAAAWLRVDGLQSLYDHALEEAIDSHDRFLPGDENCERVMDRLHAYAYFLEGLLPAANRPECAIALRQGIARLSRYLREIAPVFERCDVCAQLLRLRLYADALGVLPLDRVSAADEAERTASFQISDSDPRLDGGFWFGRKRGQLLPFANPVSTAFSLQALSMWRQHQAGDPAFSVDALI